MQTHTYMSPIPGCYCVCELCPAQGYQTQGPSEDKNLSYFPLAKTCTCPHDYVHAAAPYLFHTKAQKSVFGLAEALFMCTQAFYVLIGAQVCWGQWQLLYSHDTWHNSFLTYKIVH